MDNKKILITSGRSFIALELARLFHAAGHQVFTTDTMKVHLCRFSKAVTKNFLVASPRNQPKEFVNQLIKIAEDEKIDLIIPVYEEILYLAKERQRFPKHCQLFASSFNLVNELHNKWLFHCKMEEMGIKTPRTILIQKLEDLKQLGPCTVALKPCYSRASLHLKKWEPNQPLPSIKIEPHNPWIAQEWIVGDQYCSYSICKEGKVQAHTVYPVGYTADSKGCIIFKAIEHAKIFAWVESFVKKINFTGQIAFDFIENSDHLYAIECNPRGTNGALLFTKNDQIDRAFFNGTAPLIFAKPGTSKQLFTAMLLYGWRKSAHHKNSATLFFQELFGAKDAIFNRSDLLPFFAQPWIMLEIWRKGLRSNLSLPAFFMFDYEWNGTEEKAEHK